MTKNEKKDSEEQLHKSKDITFVLTSHAKNLTGN